MKAFITFFTLLLVLSTPLHIDTEKANGWLTDYDSALDKAKASKKNVLVYFTGSDWCPPCKMLKKDLFETNSFKAFSKEYILLYIDIPRNQDLLSTEQMNHNKKVLSKLNKKGVFPLMVALNPNGKVMDEYSGYSMNGDITYHMAFLNRNK